MIKKALLWKFLERFGVQGAQFILQIILARVLSPEHYGVVSIMIIFTTLANVFIQSGFNTALIQGKDVRDEDYSSVFWLSLALAGILYGILFALAPLIAKFYEMPAFILPFRILAIMLFPGALQSVQLAKISREMEFRKIFSSNLVAVLASGLVGIILANLGYGIWALVIQTLLNVFIASVVMWFTVDWNPRFVCNMQRIKELFSYGWKLLVSALIDTIYQDIRSLAIGRKYDSATLGYDSRGKQFPQFIITAINGTVQSVMLPAMSTKQDDKVAVKEVMRKSVTLSAYIIFPMMAGLAGIAEPLVKILLTDKWLPCVPYMQIYCFSFAFWPVHTCNLQAINAVGRSDIYLKLEIIKKSIGMIALGIALVCFDSPIAIAMTGVFTTIISCFVNSYPNKKLIDYSYVEQMKDILPSFFTSIIMVVIVLLVGQLGIAAFPTMLLQIVVGVVLYLGISIVVKLEPFVILYDMIKEEMVKRIRK